MDHCPSAEVGAQGVIPIDAPAQLVEEFDREAPGVPIDACLRRAFL
jgi:hypothetical protein